MGNSSETSVSQKPGEEAIRAKAHELWVERGSPEGDSDQDWYEAERLLIEEELASQVAAQAPGALSAASESAGSQPPPAKRSSRAAAKPSSSAPPSTGRSPKASNSSSKGRARKR
jgi:hypothetical protein